MVNGGVKQQQIFNSNIVIIFYVHLSLPTVHGGVAVREEGGLQWRDPNLPEVIGFLSSPSDVVKANAAAYLQHLTYMDDPNKQKTRNLGDLIVKKKLCTNAHPCTVYRTATNFFILFTLNRSGCIYTDAKLSCTH